MKELKEYLTTFDYIRIVIFALPFWFGLTLFLSVFLNPNISLAVILGIILTPILLFNYLKMIAKARKKRYMMIWKAKESFNNSKED